MSRIIALDPATTTGKSAELFTAVKSKLGMVPNLMRTFGHSPAALEAYLGFSATLGTGVLPAKVREQIALAVAETNSCDYCLAAHSLMGKGAGLTEAQTIEARQGQPKDPRLAALSRFTLALKERHGSVTDADLAALRGAGFNDGHIAETVAVYALNLYTNFFNHVNQTVVDLPAAPAV